MTSTGADMPTTVSSVPVTPGPVDPPPPAPVYSDLWDRHGDEARDNAQFEPERLPVLRGRRRSAF